MEIAVLRLARIFLATVFLLALGARSAIANEVRGAVSEIAKPDLVKINPGVVNGQKVDLIRVGNLPEFAIRSELINSGDLTDSQKEQLSEIRRDILDKTLTGLVVGASEIPMLVNDQTIIKVSSATKLADGDFTFFEDFNKGVLAKGFEGESSLQIKQRQGLRNNCRAFIGFLNEAVLRSTYRAGRGFVIDSRNTRGFTEFGLSVVVRGEFQVGIGKTNVMRTVARGLDIGYDMKSKELVIRRIVRHEKMDGGTAMTLGPKAELRAYRANLNQQESLSHEGKMHGTTWYPPAPPLVTFASETFPGYHSVGTAVALNVFDVFVPTYLFNTVNEFDASYRVTRISLSPSTYLKLTVAAVKKMFAQPQMLATSGLQRRSAGRTANQCRAIFTQAY